MRQSLYDYCTANNKQNLLAEWDSENNLPLTPKTVSHGSKKKIWWSCKAGHGWQAAPYTRTSGSGCPVCAGKAVVANENDLASAYPDIAAQWHPTKNGELTPQTCTPASNRKVWWLCPKGHEYQAAVGARTVSHSDCPYCAGRKVLKGFNDLATLEPNVASQWHPSLNGDLTPELVTAGSSRKVWWQCVKGHVWEAVVYSRTGSGKCGCPVCAGRFNKVRERRYKAAIEDREKQQTESTNPPPRIHI